MANAIGGIIAVLGVAAIIFYVIREIRTPHLTNALMKSSEYLTLVSELTNESRNTKAQVYKVEGIGTDTLASRILDEVKYNHLLTPRSIDRGKASVFRYNQGQELFFYKSTNGDYMAAVCDRYFRNDYKQEFPPYADTETMRFFKTHSLVYYSEGYYYPQGFQVYEFETKDPVYAKWIQLQYGEVIKGWNTIYESNIWEKACYKDLRWIKYYSRWKKENNI
ncbi:MAG: hypothetical protein MJZ61_08800 [Bacteroidales bacterium]|nr:hypothetical protein [Bacteroidales bacterium]